MLDAHAATVAAEHSEQRSVSRESAIAAPVSIAVLQGQTPVRAWNGVQVWTDYSAIDKRWPVVVRRAGQITVPAAIPPG